MKTEKNDINYLIKGLIGIIIYYLIFTIAYFKLNNFIIVNKIILFSTIATYFIPVIFLHIELTKKIKSKKTLLIPIIALIILMLIRFLHGTKPFRPLIYTFYVEKALDNFVQQITGEEWFIRTYGNSTLAYFLKITLNRICWKCFVILSYIIKTTGLIATILITERYFKNKTYAIITPLLILSHPLILKRLGSVAFSGFALSYLMISYYFLMENKFILSLISFLAASFSRTETFLLFPFFIVQFFYVNREKNTFKKLIKSKNKNKTINKIIIIFILLLISYLILFLLTNLIRFYSTTNKLEQPYDGPNTKAPKQIFEYLKLHLIHANLTKRLIDNVIYVINHSFFGIKFLSIITSLIMIFATIQNIKRKDIQIYAFNAIFFFLLYTAIRFNGIINGKYRYHIFLIYFFSLIIPSFKIKVNKTIRKPIFILLIILLYMFVLVKTCEIHENPYYPFTKEEISEIYKTKMTKKCQLIFLGETNPFIYYNVPKDSLIIPVYYENQEIIREINENKEENKCLYVILTTTSKKNNFYTKAIWENWCKNILECKKKMTDLVNLLNKIGKKIYSYNIDEEDVGGIYLIENK